MQTTPTPTELDALAVAELAYAASVDVRTMRRALGGAQIRGLTGARIRRVISERYPHGCTLAAEVSR